ncbi:MAG: hypothetical protein CVV11_17120 [Gammaproteobacteria bacterium HGW-Gammaproteobacteria-15]|nr:MAG: hypothetical protein CVV11_17120 [Gammaproteobacteria bacterium HGW-Gammaproteobacteria-15]
MMLIFLQSLLISLLLFGCATPVANVKDYDIAIHNKAFAVSTNGVIGAAWGQTTVHIAIDKAINACTQQGGVECKVININGTAATTYPAYKADDRVTDISKRTMNFVTNEGVTVQYRCADLTKSFATSLLSQGHSYLDKDGDGIPCEYAQKTYKPQSSGNCHWVSGYTRKNGAYVKGHMRCR